MTYYSNSNGHGQSDTTYSLYCYCLPQTKSQASYALIVALLHMQHTTALNPGSVKMPPPAEIPEELKKYYASLTMEPSDVLSFGHQIASGMVSNIT